VEVAVRSYVLICAVLVLALFANAAELKDAPSPALIIPGEDNDISLGGIVLDRGIGNIGTGMDASVSHYFTRHFGIATGADLLRSDYVQFKEYGYRAGPTVRLNGIWGVQPFVRSLFGYSRFKETSTGPTQPYVSGFSYLVGTGGDLRLSGLIFARVAADYEEDPNALHPHNIPTRVLRLSMGLSYRFGGAGR
jgi:hypothetical protein